MQVEHWIYFDCKFLSKNVFCTLSWRIQFPQAAVNQMIQEFLQSHPSVCGFYTMYAAFQLKFRQEEVFWSSRFQCISIYK